MIKNFSVIVMSALIAGCSQPQTKNEEVDEVASLRSLDPRRAEEDAEEALANNDRRLLAVAGFTLELPGTTLSLPDAERLNGIREIEGTSDSHDTEEQARLDERVREYAARYNRTILEQGRVEVPAN